MPGFISEVYTKGNYDYAEKILQYASMSMIDADHPMLAYLIQSNLQSQKEKRL